METLTTFRDQHQRIANEMHRINQLVDAMNRMSDYEVSLKWKTGDDPTKLTITVKCLNNEMLGSGRDMMNLDYLKVMRVVPAEDRTVAVLEYEAQ